MEFQRFLVLWSIVVSRLRDLYAAKAAQVLHGTYINSFHSLC